MADYPRRICPHLHISLQSGSDRDPGADAASRAGRAAHRAMPRGVGRLGPAGPGRRRDRRFSGRERGGFCGHLPGGGRGGLLQAARLPLQSAAGDARRRLARPRAGPRPAASRRPNWPTWAGGCGSGTSRACWAAPCRCSWKGPWPIGPGMLLGTADRYAPVELPGGPDLVGRLVGVTAQTRRAGANSGRNRQRR